MCECAVYMYVHKYIYAHMHTDMLYLFYSEKIECLSTEYEQISIFSSAANLKKM